MPPLLPPENEENVKLGETKHPWGNGERRHRSPDPIKARTDATLAARSSHLHRDRRTCAGRWRCESSSMICLFVFSRPISSLEPWSVPSIHSNGLFHRYVCQGTPSRRALHAKTTRIAGRPDDILAKHPPGRAATGPTRPYFD